MLPDSWKTGNANVVSSFVYMALILGAIVIVFGRVGRWPALFRRLARPVGQPAYGTGFLHGWHAERIPGSLPQRAAVRASGPDLGCSCGFSGSGASTRPADSSILMLQLENLTPVSGRPSSVFLLRHQLFAFRPRCAAGCLQQVRHACRSCGVVTARRAGAGRPVPGRRRGDSCPGARRWTRPEWADLRASGAPAAADRLAHEARSGLMNDVDHARITPGLAVRTCAAEPAPGIHRQRSDERYRSICSPSGARDLAAPRTARHDLYTAQVRIGAASRT